jgi:lipopolysaccharide export system permease protein
MLQFFTGVLFVFVFVIFMGQFTTIFTYAARYGADMVWVMSVMFYMLPDILVLSIPLAFQISILMTLTSLGQSGEVMALRAAGFSFGEIARPLFIFAVFLCVLMFYVSGWLSPQGRHLVEEGKEDIASRISRINIEPKTFIDLGDWNIFAENAAKNGGELYQVYLTRKNDKNVLSTKINAAEGKTTITNTGITLDLFKGQMQRLEALESRKIITAEFDKYSITIPLTQKIGAKRALRASELTTPQLFAAIKNGGLNAKQEQEFPPEPAYRLALALASLVFFFLSCPVAFVTTKKAGRTAGMVFSIVFIFAYLGLLTTGNSIAKNVNFAYLAYWAPLLPVLAGLPAGLYLWRRKLSN